MGYFSDGVSDFQRGKGMEISATSGSYGAESSDNHQSMEEWIEFPGNPGKRYSMRSLKIYEEENKNDKKGGNKMREIRFRAWDKEGFDLFTKESFYKEKKHYQFMYYDVQNIYDCCECENSPGAESFGALLGNDRFIIMQFTGLLDRHGKQIFEGDILRIEGNNYRKNELFIQGWCNEYGFRLYDPKIFDKKDIYKTLMSNLEIVGHDLHLRIGYRGDNISEVIGNIYENPELLKPREDER